jgi:hypothetical protein
LGVGIVAQAASAGSKTLVVVDASTFPPAGYIKVGSDPAINYARTGNVLSLGSPLKSDVQAGDHIQVGNGLIVGAIGKGSGCAVQPGTPGSSNALLVGLALMLCARTRRRSQSR